ncbi:MAG TPA: hypothetical protein VM680_01950 [Verrucomicrobiae bacterium]|nr:hypothetical protein [Verrucomicrobiae bacterium]
MAAAAAAPVNDNFSQATVLNEIMLGTTIAYSAANATLESFETTRLGITDPRGSVWWKWRPKYSGSVSMKTSVDLSVYRGTSSADLNALALIWSRGPSLPDASQGFSAEAGSTYWIRPAPPSNGSSPEAGSWSMSQLIQKVEPSNSSVGEPVTFTLSSVDQTLPLPNNISMAISYRPIPSVLNYDPVTNLTFTNITLGVFGSWQPTFANAYLLTITATYESGETWQRSVQFIVRTANDDLARATDLPANANSGIFPFQTDYSSAEADEPAFPAGSPTRSVWWRWQPDHSVEVRFSVERPLSEPIGSVAFNFNSAPRATEIFTGNSLKDLTRVAHNDGRIGGWPFRGYTVLRAEAGKTYYVRVSDPELFNYLDKAALRMEPLDAPAAGLVNLSTIGVVIQADGSTNWQVLGRIVSPDGSPARIQGLVASFWVGPSIEMLAWKRDAAVVGEGLIVNGAPVAATFAQGLVSTDGLADEEIYVQLRAWANTWSYGDARRAGEMVGRSRILKIKAGSELSGPAILAGLGDVELDQRPFNPGSFSAGDNSGVNWNLKGLPGTYVIETSDLMTPWRTIAILDNPSGSMVFVDARAEKPDVSFYRSRLID